MKLFGFKDSNTEEDNHRFFIMAHCTCDDISNHRFPRPEDHVVFPEPRPRPRKPASIHHQADQRPRDDWFQPKPAMPTPVSSPVTKTMMWLLPMLPNSQPGRPWRTRSEPLLMTRDSPVTPVMRRAKTISLGQEMMAGELHFMEIHQRWRK